MGRRIRTASGILCLLAGVVLLLRAGALFAEGAAWQRSQSAHLDPILTVDEGAEEIASGPPGVSGAEGPREPEPGEAVARLRVPRVGIDVVVVEGTDPRDLTLGPGHMRGSALPGEAGNCIIAGHRDGPFGRLRSIREGDLVEVTSRVGGGLYRITAIHVVDRTDTGPLAPLPMPALTLITCYPFRHVGPAPQRLVVRGAQIGTPSPRIR